MKRLSSLIMAAMALGAFGFAQNIRASEPVLSPRARELQPHIVPGSSTHDPDLLANRPVGNAKSWTIIQSMRTVPSTGPSIDLAHAQRPTLSPKDPRYDAALRANAEKQQFQVAPLK